MLYHLSTLEYASSIWNHSKKESINKVEAVQRRAARLKFATGDYQRTHSVAAMLQQLHWQTLQSRGVYGQTVMYNLVDIPAEHHLNRTSLQTRGHSQRFHTHTRTHTHTHTHTHTQCTGHHNYFPQAIPLWNQLPASVVEAYTLDSFKAQLSMTTLM